MKSLKKAFTFRIDSDLYEKLYHFATLKRVPIAQILRHLVLRHLPLDASEAELPPARFKRARGVSPPIVSERETFRNLCCTLYDDHLASGLAPNDAVKRANLALKALKHPWATYDVVRREIRCAGRFRKGVMTCAP